MSRISALLFVVLALACSDDGGARPPADSGPADGGGDAAVYPLKSHCNPLVTDSCLLPWPSSFYLKEDKTTKTGYRVNYPGEAMPRSKTGLVLDKTRPNLHDGFSIASQPLVFFRNGVDTTGLPGQTTVESSLTDQSLILLLEMPAGARVPFFAEMDMNIGQGEVSALTLRPRAPLKWDTDYVVVMKTGLKDQKGNLLTSPVTFQAVRDNETITDPVLKTEAARLKKMMDFLDAQKFDRKSLLLAWDFHTASKESVRGNVEGMVSEALAKLPSTGPAYKVVKVQDKTSTEDKYMMRSIDGTFSVPSYLESDKQDAVLKLDAAGKPVYRGAQDFAFRINIPRCAETASAPLPVLFFGLGLFGSLRNDMTGSFLRKLPNDLCMVVVSTEWIGLAEDDLPEITSKVIMEDFSKIPMITDRLQQAQVNMHALVKLMQGPLLQESGMKVNGSATTDGKDRYYLGISNGGIQGVAFAALEKDITRFAFNVSGGWWSLMIQRSSNFVAMAALLKIIYPSALDRAILVSLSQHFWDYTEPATWAETLLTSPLGGQPSKQILLQESRYDDQVPNLATRNVVRGIGLPLLATGVENVYGVTEKAGPLDSAYVQWDTKPTLKPPLVNTPAPKPTDVNLSAHDRVRHLASCLNQWKQYFKKDGKVVSTCSGACDPE